METFEGSAGAAVTTAPGTEVSLDAEIQETERGISHEIFGRGHDFEFFQVVRLLEILFSGAPPPGTTHSVASEKIRFRPNDEGVFPATDVRSVRKLEGGGAEVILTFMGLYGVNSPVPHAFHRSVGRGDERAEVLRDFLDIFNHRLYALFYRAWKKYRPEMSAHRSGSQWYGDVVTGLAGVSSLPRERAGLPSVLRASAFAGHLGKPSRNPEGLRHLLEAFLDGIPARIVERVPRRVPVKDRPGIGLKAARPMQLGVNSLIGRRVLDVSGKFRLELGPMTLAQMREVSPGGSKAATVQWLTRAYSSDFLDYDAELKVMTDEIMPVRLGDRAFSLGANTWLGRPGRQTMSQVVSYA